MNSGRAFSARPNKVDLGIAGPDLADRPKVSGIIPPWS